MATVHSIITVALALFAAINNASPLSHAPIARSIPGPSYNISAASNGSSFEVIIVGGGPAGLSALSGLSRVRRNTLLIDSEEYRNGETRHMHDVIGNDRT
jgi:ribulose 1,5-bisphosphate synthetase/thiazole synthase